QRRYPFPGPHARAVSDTPRYRRSRQFPGGFFVGSAASDGTSRVRRLKSALCTLKGNLENPSNVRHSNESWNPVPWLVNGLEPLDPGFRRDDERKPGSFEVPQRSS